MTRSAFIVRVPEAERIVHRLRTHYDPRAAAGIPAHIVILSPFMAPELIGDDVIQRARNVFSSFGPFTFVLKDIGRWPETTILFASPSHCFTDITNAISEEFPDYPPYAEMYDEIVPHLTIADGNADNAYIAEHKLKTILDRHGPIESKCAIVDLIENSSGTWKTMHTFSLADEES
ncbi:MAG TPA: 2'-5' RNA ligase family protein [Syntrophorhabdaceae bacterium]|nr:2'-5' RNA ligase family protein [Syntrophorhabdaceae bacterium]HOW55246.1 2'-5' RNA ligase family protein [Syntrophorhabdaceae bacterium]